MHITPLPDRAVSLSADSSHSGPAELRPEARSAGGRSDHKAGPAELRPEARSAGGRSDHITELLRAWGAGDARAPEALVPLVYAELRRQAARALRREGQGHTLQATALVHEAWLRLDGQHDARWESRTQFLAVAAQMMRRVLVDHARARRALKRGGAGTLVTLGDASHAVASPDDVDVLALDDALARLAVIDPRKARLV